MIIDGISASKAGSAAPLRERATAAFLAFVEKKLGIKTTNDIRDLRVNLDMVETVRLANKLVQTGVITEFARVASDPDYPRTYTWRAVCNNETKHPVGGNTWESDHDALRAAIAEGLERFIWLTQEDYFQRAVRARAEDMARRGFFISPEKIAGFSDAQRHGISTRTISPETFFTWIQGVSLVRGRKTFVPAQVISGTKNRETAQIYPEPEIRVSTTIGLATWPTQVGAQLAGINEILEREAYMIMWLNQLSLPRYTLSSLTSVDPGLTKLFADLERYRFKVSIIKMITDAPTHAIAAVIEDTSRSFPLYTIGLKAHRNLTSAVQKAVSEALRAQKSQRNWEKAGNVWNVNTPLETIGHRDRLRYWSVPENAKHMKFLVEGKEISAEKTPWANDTENQHLERIIEWCRTKNYECISVPLTKSAKNVTPWHIEMMFMPDVQPTYLTERNRTFGCNRWKEVPEFFGYRALP
ncbi:MAG: hypothetical protein RIQ56_920, partial [Candidatus Parcubacteria bacterium]